METKKDFFPEIGKIKFEGKNSRNPLAYRYYDAEKVVMGKKMTNTKRMRKTPTTLQSPGRYLSRARCLRLRAACDLVAIAFLFGRVR